MNERMMRYDAGRTKPFYEIKQKDEVCILELLRIAKKIGIENVNFEYYATKSSEADIHFYLVEYNGYWELVVKEEDGYQVRTTDVYRIADDEVIKYQYSE